MAVQRFLSPECSLHLKGKFSTALMMSSMNKFSVESCLTCYIEGFDESLQKRILSPCACSIQRL